MGLGGGCIVGQVLHVKDTQQRYILDLETQADESFVNEFHIFGVSGEYLKSPPRDLPKAK